MLPTLLVIITHLFVVSSRQRSENQGFGDRLRCEEIERRNSSCMCIKNSVLWEINRD